MLELLAPVGSFDALKAAVQNGADAVYLGGKAFGARASANNFDKDELKLAVEYAHVRGVKVFVTVNILIKENEIKRVLEYVRYLYNIDVDAVIVQDIGLAKLIYENFPDFEMHASTQMVAHSIQDVLFLETLGFKRVVLARELSTKEIKEIKENCNVDLEVFVHGALCVCYSGQCYMSSMIGGRSGNRGRCAQPCRMVYDLYDKNSDEKVNLDASYLLSPKDLNTLEELDKIIGSGALSLKIEGRMKKPEYVATVVKSYREVIDVYEKEKRINISSMVKEDLYSVFNRKFTKGHILSQKASDIMNPEKPNNAGLYIGKALDYNPRSKKLKIKLEATLKKGDGLNIGGGNIGRIIKDGEILDRGLKGETVEIDFINDIKKGTDIYKTLDTELMNRAQKSYENDIELKKIKLRGKIVLKLNEFPVLLIKDDLDNKVKIVGNKPVEAAIKLPLEDEKIKNQIEKLGNTPFVLEGLLVEKDENISLPLSALNEIRRECIEKLEEKRKNVNKRKVCKIAFEDNKKSDSLNKEVKVRVSVKNLSMLTEIKDCDVDMIYYEDAKTLREAMEICQRFNKKIAYSMPRILRNDDYFVIENVLQSGIEDFKICNIGSINLLKGKRIYGDYFLNVLNSETIEVFSNNSLESIAISPELNTEEIKEALSKANMDVEAVVYGRMPLMVSEYCAMGVLTRNCNKDKRCANCKKYNYYLKDSTNQKFPLHVDALCRGIVYNSKILCVLDSLKDIHDAGVNVFRLDFTLEKPDNIREILESYIDVINNNFEMDKDDESLLQSLKGEGITKGHYFRGVE